MTDVVLVVDVSLPVTLVVMSVSWYESFGFLAMYTLLYLNVGVASMLTVSSVVVVDVNDMPTSIWSLIWLLLPTLMILDVTLTLG